MTLEQFKSEINELVPYWQKRLRLQDWNIQASIAESDEDIKKLEGSFAETRGTFTLKEAQILIDPKPEPDTLGDADFEVTLVHEMMHLHGKAFDKSFMGKDREKTHWYEYCGLEQMIEFSAQALVKLRREAQA